MSHQTPEKAIYLYIGALQSGNFDTISSILHQAEQDPELEALILEVNETLVDEYEASAHASRLVTIEQLISEHLPSARSPVEEDLPPLTVGEVLQRLQFEAAIPGRVRDEALNVAAEVSTEIIQVPEKLSRRSVGRMFEQLGLTVSKQLQERFRVAAIFLAMGREQNMARLAATRRQQRAEPTLPHEFCEEDIS